MSPFVHIFLGHERDRFEITPVISSNVEHVAVAWCGRLWGTFLGYLKENLDKFQGKQVQSHSFPKMKRGSSNESREDLSVELFASDKQHVLDLYCSKGKNCSYKFYWPSFGMAYGNPIFSELGRC